MYAVVIEHCSTLVEFLHGVWGLALHFAVFTTVPWAGSNAFLCIVCHM